MVQQYTQYATAMPGINPLSLLDLGEEKKEPHFLKKKSIVTMTKCSNQKVDKDLNMYMLPSGN